MKTSFKIIAMLIASQALGAYTQIYSGLSRVYIPNSSSYGDCDNDGLDEMVVFDFPHINIYKGGVIVDYITSTIPYDSACPIILDFNQDGYHDIAIGYIFSGVFKIYEVYSSYPPNGTVGANDNPPDFKLKPAHPNPFNPSTSIDFTLEQTDRVKLTIHNINGQQVAVLQNGLMERGDHTVDFTASGLASGVYTYTLEIGGFKQTKSFTLVK